MSTVVTSGSKAKPDHSVKKVDIQFILICAIHKKAACSTGIKYQLEFKTNGENKVCSEFKTN